MPVSNRTSPNPPGTVPAAATRSISADSHADATSLSGAMRVIVPKNAEPARIDGVVKLDASLQVPRCRLRWPIDYATLQHH